MWIPKQNDLDVVNAEDFNKEFAFIEEKFSEYDDKLEEINDKQYTGVIDLTSDPQINSLQDILDSGLLDDYIGEGRVFPLNNTVGSGSVAQDEILNDQVYKIKYRQKDFALPDNGYNCSLKLVVRPETDDGYFACSQAIIDEISWNMYYRRGDYFAYSEEEGTNVYNCDKNDFWETNGSWNVYDLTTTVVNNLNSTSSDFALSANQGRVLNEQITNIVETFATINYVNEVINTAIGSALEGDY